MPERSNVLVVDDDDAILLVTVRVLSRYFTVLAAQSPQEALALAEGRTLALILCDYTMPHQSGVSLIRALRERGHAAPAVLVTAAPDAEEIAEAVNAGLVALVIEKPWSPSVLVCEAIRLTRET